MALVAFIDLNVFTLYLIALRTDTIYSTTDSDKQPTSNLKGFLMNHFLLLEMQE